ncbi:MAG: flagella basal body P-ring formation protein FlgA [Gammaproteobacteria bacterium]|nr:MAG: flagella basal body P-ring formation protein FlgA [Gammaproteobacteria bacterium]
MTLFCCMLMSLSLSAGTLQSVSSIEQAAYEYALDNAQAQYDNPQVAMNSLDSRLRLQACESSLNVFSKVVNSGLGNQTIGVSCLSPVAWTVYVPVKVKVFKHVVVVVKTLTANQLITAEDIALKPWDISSLRQGYFSSIKSLVGQESISTIGVGRIIKKRSVRAPKIIRRGEHIMLVAQAGSMQVKMSGTALEDASLGQRVKVKNSSSKRIVEGVVNAAGIVYVSM